MSGRSYRLRSGRGCRLSSPRLPFVRHYRVLHVSAHEGPLSPREREELVALAARLARRVARATFGDQECYSLLFNAGRTRRQPHDHVHIILARSPGEKRWALLFMALKRLLRWRRWPLVRWLRRSRERAP